MNIHQHRLHGDRVYFEESPNRGDTYQPGYPDMIVLHYTASVSVRSAIETLSNPQREVSAHLVIARDGAVTQLVPFDTIAWHAGKSWWKGRMALNRYSIGIEIDNAGRLEAQGGEYVSWFEQRYPEEQVVRAVHPNQNIAAYWHAYPDEQLQIVEQVCALLLGEYEIAEIVGHDEIAPDRKEDPGPAFPLQAMRLRLLSNPTA